MREGHMPCFGASASVLCLAFVAGTAHAQAVSAGKATPAVAESATSVQEIIVTAERRRSSIQTTPIPMNAVSGMSLEKQQITDLSSLSTELPSVSFSRIAGDARVFIRGIGLDSITPGSDPRVAIYTDGAYNPRAQAALSSFYDIERVEVLSGPQGTLYGRNATAGAINIISRDPGNQLNGYGTLTLGDYGTVRLEGAVGGPLTDSVSGRLAFQTSDHSGYGKNIVTGGDVDDESTRAVRGKIKIDEHPLVATLQADYFLEDDHSGGYHFFGEPPGKTLFATTIGGTAPTNPRDYAGPGPDTRIEAYGPTLTLEYSLGRLLLTSISAYKHVDAHTFSSPDTSTLAAELLPLDILEKSDSFSEETRLSGKVGPVDLVAGAYYFHEWNMAGNQGGVNTLYFTGGDVNFLSGAVDDRGTQVTNAYAVFTQNTVNITDKLGLDLGARYSIEQRKDITTNSFDLAVPYVRFPLFAPSPGDVATEGSHTWYAFNPKVGVHYKVTKDIFLYASWSTGFKSGGFNVAFSQPPFNPEKITDIEAGVKADLLDKKLRVNLGGFHYGYDNLQVNLVGGPSGTQLITENAAKATLYGAELNVTAVPMKDLEIHFDADYLHSQYDDYTTKDPAGLYTGQPLPDGTKANPDGSYSLAGHPLTYAPDWRLHGSVAYTFHAGDIGITPRADATYTGLAYFSPFSLPYVSQPAYTLVDLSVNVTLGDRGWSGSMFVKNATDQFYKLSATIGSSFIGYPIVGLVGTPRTFGVSVTKRF